MGKGMITALCWSGVRSKKDLELQEFLESMHAMVLPFITPNSLLAMDNIHHLWLWSHSQQPANNQPYKDSVRIPEKAFFNLIKC